MLQTSRWAAWVLAVFPFDADSLLVAAAALRAEGGVPAREWIQGLDTGFMVGDATTPTPDPAVSAITVQLGTQFLALLWVATPPPDERRAHEFSSRAAELSAEVRRNLPGSTTLAVAYLTPSARDLFEQAARVSMRGLAGTVQIGHLAAALLEVPGLDSLPAPVGPWPDPDRDVIELLAGTTEDPDPVAALRARVAQRLATGRTSAGRLDSPTRASEEHYSSAPLLGVLSGEVPGVFPVLPTPALSPHPASQLEVDGGGTANRAAEAAEELAVHLGRLDTAGVVLAGSATAQSEALTALAVLAESKSVAWLSGRRLLRVDPMKLAPAHEELLAQALTYRADQIMVAVQNPTSRTAMLLRRTATAAHVPIIWLTTPRHALARDPDLGDPPVVLLSNDWPAGRSEIFDLLSPIAEQIAAAHGVALTPGVVAAAAGAAPVHDLCSVPTGTV